MSRHSRVFSSILRRRSGGSLFIRSGSHITTTTTTPSILNASYSTATSTTSTQPPPPPITTTTNTTTTTFQSRLEDHYYSNLLEDIMILSYDHSSPLISQSLLNSNTHPEWSHTSPESFPLDTFAKSLSELPTATTPGSFPTTSLLHKSTIDLVNQEKLKRKSIRSYKPLYNPIDYTSIKKTRTHTPTLPTSPPFSPLPSHLPTMEKIHISLVHLKAIDNKYTLLSAMMALECMTGLLPTPVFSNRNRAELRLKKGMPIGAEVTLQGSHMYHFLDKLVQIVLPRLREWDGVEPAGMGTGVIQLDFPATAMSVFPDIEPFYDMFPKFFDFSITLHTTGKTDAEAIMLLSGFQMPFKDSVPVVEEDEVDDSDPWAKYKKKKKGAKGKKGGRR